MYVRFYSQHYTRLPTGITETARDSKLNNNNNNNNNNKMN